MFISIRAAIIVSMSSAAFAAEPSLKLSDDELRSVRAARVETVQLLQQKKFFRSATCKQIADAFLADAGLPALGKSVVVKGRGPFDRAKAKEELPVFTDEVTLGLRTKLKASVSKEKNWELTVLREKKDAGDEMTVTMAFRPRTEKSPSVCEVESIGFSSKFLKDGKPSTLEIRNIKPEQCLDLYLLTGIPEVLSANMSQATYEWLKKDCSVALRYIPDPKLLTK